MGHDNFTFSGQNTRNQHLSASCIYSISGRRADPDADTPGLALSVMNDVEAVAAVRDRGMYEVKDDGWTWTASVIAALL